MENFTQAGARFFIEWMRADRFHLYTGNSETLFRTARFFIEWMRADRGYHTAAASPVLSANTTSTAITVTATAPAGTAYARLDLLLWAAGHVYFADLSFKRVP
ncbi:MAG: hypothetical protein RMK29_21530 [Myxococcales bacterium]|nr:hypothetical protein [Myxococcales bacterium]